jgi:uncharacterized protein YegP (UPF0339 family)
MSYFEVYRDTTSQYRWRFVASNGRIIAVSSESYWNKADCLASIVLVKQEAPTAPVRDSTT